METPPVPPKRDKESLTEWERWAELFAAVGILLLFGFFNRHQQLDTGFFTAGFSPLEKLALYGPLAVALAPPIIRMSTGQRNPARPVEAAASLCLALGSLHLLRVFPFDYRYLGDVLPSPLNLALIWVTNPVARIILTLQVIIGPITAILNLIQYAAVRGRQTVRAA